MSIAVVNPLGGALRHYTDALVAGLDIAARFDVDEPSVAGASRLSWLRRYARALRAAGRAVGRGGTVIVTWPVIGYLDLVVARVLPRSVRLLLVVHDPEPLVHAVGLDCRAQRAARTFGRRATIVVHGSEALAAVSRHGFGPVATVLPHPVLPAPTTDAGRSTRPAPRLQTDSVIRVLGQWKPDRDVEMLAALAPRLRDDFRLEIHGRGWPEVPGWTVRDAFVPEAELDALLVESAAVLVPYRRFFQSGVAIRALEVGTPFVGPRVDALSGLAGDLDEMLVDRPTLVDDWERGVGIAVGTEPASLRARAVAAAEHAARAWAVALGLRARR